LLRGIWVTDNLNEILGQVDVAFVMDTTGSMSPYILEARDHARQVAEKIAKEGDLDLRFAVVEYRDHPPMANFVTYIYPFGDGDSLERALHRLGAYGGGDTPEAVWDGLVDAGNKLEWRPQADHRCFLIGDSPPHGYVTGSGFFGADNWPEGCPCGLNSGGIAELYDYHKIKLHALSVAGNPDTLRAFREVSEPTGGDCTEVHMPAAATASYGSTMSTTGMSITGSRIYYDAVSAVMDKSDASVAAELGWSEGAVFGAKAYLRGRGIKIPGDEKNPPAKAK
jgi:hypothetical protein